MESLPPTNEERSAGSVGRVEGAADLRLIEDSDLVWQEQFCKEHEKGSRDREVLYKIMIDFLA